MLECLNGVVQTLPSDDAGQVAEGDAEEEAEPARAVPVARPGTAVFHVSGAVVAATAQELGLYLRLDSGLDDPGTQAGDLLQHLDQVTIGGEQSVDVGANLLGG